MPKDDLKKQQAKGIYAFTSEGREFRYSFNEVTVEQAEAAITLLEWKYNLDQTPAETYEQLRRSQASFWRLMIASILLREVKNGALLPYNQDKAEVDAMPFVKALPVTERERLKEMTEDFFQKAGENAIYSAVSQGEKKVNATEMLYFLMDMATKKSNAA